MMQHQIAPQPAPKGHVNQELNLRQHQKGRWVANAARSAGLEAAARDKASRNLEGKLDDEAESS
jgi:hypothetical protein